MISLTGYQFEEQAYLSNNSTIYQGIKDLDKKPPIKRSLNKKSPITEKLEYFRNEFEIAKKLSSNGIILSNYLEKSNSIL